MVPDVGAAGLFFVVVLPLLFAIPMLATAITIAFVASFIGQSMYWGFVGLITAFVSVLVFGGLAISTDFLGADISEDGSALAALLVWFLFTWGSGSAVVLIPMWYINKNEPTL